MGRRRRQKPPRTKYSKSSLHGLFAARFGGTPPLHFLRHLTGESYFTPKPPRGWAYDIGAQDVFLDKFGVLARERLYGLLWKHDYQFVVQRCMTR